MKNQLQNEMESGMESGRGYVGIYVLGNKRIWVALDNIQALWVEQELGKRRDLETNNIIFRIAMILVLRHTGRNCKKRFRVWGFEFLGFRLERGPEFHPPCLLRPSLGQLFSAG